MAIGLGLIFGILNLINFAHGDMLMVGSYAALFMLVAGIDFWWAATIGIAISIIVGLLIERIAYRPLRGATQISTLLTSFAVSVFMENGAQVVFTPNSRAFRVPALLDTVIIYDQLRIKSLDLIAILVAIIFNDFADHFYHSHEGWNLHACSFARFACFTVDGYRCKSGYRSGFCNRLGFSRSGWFILERQSR